MPRRLGAATAAGLALAALLLASFARLAADPSALIADADRPGVDLNRKPGDVSPGNDATRLFLPHHLAIAGHWNRLGRVPGWDDRGFGGRPLVGNPQAGLFYPPAWLAWWGGAPSSLGWITVGHLFWGGLGTYALAGTLGLGGWGRLTSAGCFQLSPYVLAQANEGHYPHVWAATWYPWAFLAALRLSRGDLRAGLALPPILAAAFLAGHPQEGHYLLIALGAWVAVDGLARLRAGRGRSALVLWGAWAVALTLAVGLVGVELVPDALAHPWDLRLARLTLRLASRYHPFPVNALQLLGPGALGGPADFFGHENYWESVLSIGLVPMVLAVVGAAWSWDRRGVRAWAWLVLAALIFASGRKLGLFAALFHLVPGMDRFRVPSRALFLASLGASVLAGFGVEALRSVRDRTAWDRLARRWGIVAATLATAILAGRWSAGQGAVVESDFRRPPIAGALATGPGRLPEGARWLLGLSRLSRDPAFWLVLGGTTIGLAWGRGHPRDRRAVAAALGLLGLGELAWHGHEVIATSPAARFLGPDPIGRALRLASGDGPGPPRLRAVDALYDDLRAGQLGLAKANVNDSFQIQHAADLYERLYDLFDRDRFDRDGPMDRVAALRRRQVRQAVLDRMAVSLLVSDHPDPDAPWSPVASGSMAGSPFVVSRNPTAVPRAYVVPRAEVAPDDGSMVDRFPEVDPRQAVLMASDPLADVRAPRQPFTPAAWSSDDPDRIVLRVATTGPGLLVVADTWMPGWTAEVDGRPAPISRGNRAQRVVPLPDPGRHEIRLAYRPPGLRAGLALTAAAAVAWAALVLAATLAGRRLADL